MNITSLLLFSYKQGKGITCLRTYFIKEKTFPSENFISSPRVDLIKTLRDINNKNVSP